MNSEEMLKKLRDSVSSRLSDKRYIHTLGVEKMAAKLAEFCLPEKKFELSVSALLHDITKEEAPAFHLEILSRPEGILYKDELSSTQVLHSFTAPYIIKRDYPEFATEEILNAVEKHTVADSFMSVFDEILFLADFIEDGRKYPDSVATRKYVFDNMESGNVAKNISVLHRACLMEIDSTLSHLKTMGKDISERTLLAKKFLLSKI